LAHQVSILRGFKFWTADRDVLVNKIFTILFFVPGKLENWENWKTEAVHDFMTLL
jgi:hypothetical protein